MNKHLRPFKSKEVGLQHYLDEGFVVGTARCEKCHYESTLIRRPENGIPEFECPKCEHGIALVQIRIPHP